MDHDDNPEDDDQPEAVGYCQPPKKHRFKPGRSGNPRGRPKKQAGSLRDVIVREAGERVAAIENGRKRWMTKQDLIGKTLLNKAMKGDLRSIKLITDILDTARQAQIIAAERTTCFTLKIGDKDLKTRYEQSQQLKYGDQNDDDIEYDDET